MNGRITEVIGKQITVVKSGMNGESAYQIAVRNGFVGTEAEWLDSLKGENANDPSLGRFTWNQAVPASVWVINHDLHYNPGGITVIDSSHREISGGDIDYIDIDNLTITFGSAFSGKAYLS